MTAALGGARTFASRYWGVLGILAIWQVYVSTQNLNSIVVPSPTAVFADVLTRTNPPGTNMRYHHITAYATGYVRTVGF